MNILYISHYYPPEMGAPAARVSELSSHWVHAGHAVQVLTAFPNHPTGRIPEAYRAKFWRFVWREQVDGVMVTRTWLLPLPNRRPLQRILNYGSFCLSACLTGLLLPRPDVLIATSPQLLVGLSGWWLSRIKRVPFILEVRDLWPESIEAAGVGRRRSPFMRALAGLAGFLYQTCDHLVVVSPAFKDVLVEQQNVPKDKISLIENGVETDMFSPGAPCQQLRQSWGLENKFVVSYIGTLGFAHGLHAVLEAAALLQAGFPDIVFLFVGEGVEKAQLHRLTARLSLRNVCFVGEQPRTKIPDVIRTSDVCLVTLRAAEVFKTVIPTKLLEFMACGRPVVLGVDGQAREIVEQAQAGLYVEPDNPTGLAEAIRRLYDKPCLREQLGLNGRRYIVEHLSRPQTATDYLRLLERVCHPTNGRPLT